MVLDRLIFHFLLQARTNLSNRLPVFLGRFGFSVSCEGCVRVCVCVMSLMSRFRIWVWFLPVTVQGVHGLCIMYMYALVKLSTSSRPGPGSGPGLDAGHT